MNRRALRSALVFDSHTEDVPEDVRQEVERLWNDAALDGHFTNYWPWDSEDYEDYPLIHKYLSDRNVNTCLIHWCKED